MYSEFRVCQNEIKQVSKNWIFSISYSHVFVASLKTTLFIYECMIYYYQMISHTVLIPKNCVDNFASCTWDTVCEAWNIAWILYLSDVYFKVINSINNNAFLLYILNNLSIDILDQMRCDFFVPFYFWKEILNAEIVLQCFKK